jgi:polyisoprenoid-binding protein YceI
MHRWNHLIVALVLPAVLLLLLSAAPPGSTQSRPQTFKVDPGDSSVIFKVRHLGLGSLFGRFNSVRGGYTWDEGDPPNGSIHILVAAESVDSNDPARDARFKDEQFLHAGEFSTISFTSNSIKRLHGSVFEIGGDLTLRGVRRPVTAEVEWFGAKDTARHGYRSGFEARFTINCSNFDIPDSDESGEFGDEVMLIVAIEGLRK